MRNHPSPIRPQTFWKRIATALAGLRDDETGQDLVEYALIAVFLGLAAVASLQNVTTSVTDVFVAVSRSFGSNV